MPFHGVISFLYLFVPLGQLFVPLGQRPPTCSTPVVPPLQQVFVCCNQFLVDCCVAPPNNGHLGLYTGITLFLDVSSVDASNKGTTPGERESERRHRHGFILCGTLFYLAFPTFNF